MAHCLSLKGDSFNREAWIDDVCQKIVSNSPEATYPVSQLCLQWCNFREDLLDGETWLHSVGGIRGVTVRPEKNGVLLSIPAGNSSGDFELAWELMRLGVKHGAEAHSEGEDDVLSLSAKETERITREIGVFHWRALLSQVKDSVNITLPVAGRIQLEISPEDCAGGADALEAFLVEKMNRYSQVYCSSLMRLTKGDVKSLLSVYAQVPTLVDANTELIHLAGDNLPPDIAGNLKPLKADFVYDLLEAERLGDYIYLPAPSSDFILQALVAVATSENTAPAPEQDVPIPVIPTPDDAAIGNEMTGSDWATLSKSPCLIFLLVASADGSIDKKEMTHFGKLLKNHAQIPSPIVRKILNITSSNVGGIFESMGDINPGIALIEVGALLQSGKLPAEDSRTVANFLYKLGEEVASASGGLFGFGSKISKKEADILAMLKLLLNI